MTRAFKSFLTVFQSYQENGADENERLCSMETPFTVEKILHRPGLEQGTARSVGQRLIH